ncbi:hypothetical protein DB346_24860 [Verrucomicrobia bacterium LW23]|nr:hypothetical protein DB346_24860 [Verrucomicrobia bacterium LW23]
MDFTLLHLMAPELAALVALLVCLGYDYGALRHEPAFVREPAALRICCSGLLTAVIASLILLRVDRPDGTLFDGQIVATTYTLSLKALVYGGAIICLIFSRGAPRIQHISEYHALVVLAAIGVAVAVSTRNLLLIFLALELTALCQYSLVGLDRTRSGVEAAFKYFTFGATAGAFFLFGLSYLYGAVNLLSLSQMSPALASVPLPSSLLTVAYLFVLAGLGFKLASAPFHYWVPETYRHAPTPVVAWIAGPSKLAALAVLIQILLPTLEYPLLKADWIAALSCMAALSLVLGTVGALRQVELKRLLAYSAVVHAGYTLIGVAGGTRESFATAVFYSIVYVLATMVAFGVVLLACERQGRPATLDGLRGLATRSPLLAALLLGAVATLAGIPPLPGFFGKYFLFASAIGGATALPPAWTWLPYVLVALALAASAVSLYYYFLILKAALVTEDRAALPNAAAEVHGHDAFADDGHPDERGGTTAIRSALCLARQDYETKRALPELLALWVLALLLAFTGLLPAPLLDLISQGLNEM